MSEASPVLARAASEEAIHEAELRHREALLGPSHPDLADSLSNLAILYNQRGDFERAQPLYERALRIYEAVYGPSSTEVAHTLTDLAVLHLEQVCVLFHHFHPILCHLVIESSRSFFILLGMGRFDHIGLAHICQQRACLVLSLKLKSKSFAFPSLKAGRWAGGSYPNDSTWEGQSTYCWACHVLLHHPANGLGNVDLEFYGAGGASVVIIFHGECRWIYGVGSMEGRKVCCTSSVVTMLGIDAGE